MKFQTDPIPVKPWVKKYIENGNRVPKYIVKALHALLCKHKGIFTEMVDTSQYSTTIKFTIPDYIFDKNGFRLTATNIIVFNSLIEEFIKDRFEYALELKIMWAKTKGEKFFIVDLIADLREHFGISENELTHEAIKKSLYRFCKRNNIDFEEVKILEKSVPKLRLKSAEEFGIAATLFRRRCNIKKRAFYNWVNSGYIKTIKLGGRVYVEIDSLPDELKKYMLDFTDQKNKVKDRLTMV